MITKIKHIPTGTKWHFFRANQQELLRYPLKNLRELIALFNPFVP